MSAAVHRPYYGWYIVAACIVSQVAANGLTYNSYSLFLSSWSLNLQTPISILQLSMTAMLIAASALAPVAGAFADRYSARKLYAFGLVGIAVFYFLMSQVTSGWQIVALYGLIAPFPHLLATNVMANTVISRWFVRRRGLALGFNAFGVGMGGVIWPPLIAPALPTLGWRAIWGVGALLVLAVVLPTVVALMRQKPDPVAHKHSLSSDGKETVDAESPTRLGPPTTAREIIRRKNFWLIVASYLPLMAIYAAVLQNLAPYASQHGLSEMSVGTLVSTFCLAHLVATIIAGQMSDRFGNRICFAGLGLIAVLGSVILAFATNGVGITIGCICIGALGAFNTIQAAAIACEFESGAIGKAIGLSYLILPLGSLAPVFVAKVQESTGSYTPALLPLAVIGLVSCGFSFVLNERGRAPGATGPAVRLASSE